MATPKIVVIGSCNIDFSTYVPYLPKPGETLHASKMLITHGGKGANQCVAATRLGASTAMIGRLGDDLYGRNYLSDFQKEGVNTDFLNITEDTTSGTALITVSSSGENQIIIVAGANGKLSKEDIQKAAPIIRNADVVVFQFETPLEATLEGLKLVSEGKGKSIVNAAPAIPKLGKDFLKLSDIFCVNETEAEILTDVTVDSITDAEAAIQKLLDEGCRAVVLTLGAQGVVFATKQDPAPVHVPANKVATVDTTGAGDAFVGAMACYLAYHPDLPLVENIKRCCDIAAITTKSRGAQPSYPYHKDLPQSLFQ